MGQFWGVVREAVREEVRDGVRGGIREGSGRRSGRERKRSGRRTSGRAFANCVSTRQRKFERRSPNERGRVLREVSAQGHTTRVEVQTTIRNNRIRKSTLKKQHGREQTKCDQRRSTTMHHPIIPGRQGPTHRVSPNRHGNRSRSHKEKSAQKRIPKPTSGHQELHNEPSSQDITPAN